MINKLIASERILRVLISCCIPLVLWSCSSSDNSTNSNNNTANAFSITINGAGMTNRKIEFGTAAVGTTASAIASYSLTANKTGIAFNGGDYKINGNQVGASISFPGKAAGTFDFSQEGVSASLNIGITSGLGELFASVDQTGSLTVSSYGEVGGLIKGSFSGTMQYIDGLKAPTPVTVTGSFTAYRFTDAK